MTHSVNGLMQASQMAWQNRRNNVSAATPSAAGALGGNSSGALPAADATGIQSFGSELQSFLLSLQSNPSDPTNGQPGGSPNATNTAVSTDPASVGLGAPTDASGNPVQPGALTHVAERLQNLLQGLTGTTDPAAVGATATNSASANATPSSTSMTAAASGSPDTLESVLDKLQATLTQALQSYGTQATTTATTSILS